MVTVEGEDREGFCHSIGSACRETRRASWNKAALEAVSQWKFNPAYVNGKPVARKVALPVNIVHNLDNASRFAAN